MATQLQIINRVQRRLRETVTSSVATTEYSKLLGELLNDIIQELNKYDWPQQESTEEITVVQGTRTYDIPNTSGDSALVFGPDNLPLCFRFDDGSDTTGVPMIYVNSRILHSWVHISGGTTSDDPPYFTVDIKTDNSGLETTLFPMPDASRLLRITVKTPQSKLAVDGSDDNTSIALPEELLYLGTMFLAANERGEELGEPGNIVEQRYYSALEEAIYNLNQRRGRTNELEFVRN